MFAVLADGGAVSQNPRFEYIERQTSPPSIGKTEMKLDTRGSRASARYFGIRPNTAERTIQQKEI